MVDANPYPASGEILDGKYRIEKLLGEGGMGAVARATHLLLHRTVAVKFMNPQFMTFPGAVERFLNEGRASGAISSDHVVPVSDVGCLPSGTPYLVMECLYGLDLADLLARDGPSGLPIERAVHFVLQVLRGLQAAHAIGIIHRDMKPSNCFVVTHDGKDDFVKILDFGISKIAQPGSASLTQTNSALGTPLYMSPEQARSPRDVDARSDLYSVGVILYELLSGHTPFFSESGEFTEILFKLFTADPPPIKSTRPDLPDELAAVVHKALAREVPDRYASALEFAEALVPFAGPRSIDLVERMRVYQPPSQRSVMPTEGLPTSLAAFSQLQKHSTDVMVNRPATDLQKGPPVTEIVAGSPGMAVPKKVTEVLNPGQAAVPERVEMRVRPEEALGRTQLHAEPSKSPVQTDLGASRDMTPAEEAPRRSPLVYAIPVLGILVMAALGAIVLTVVGDKKSSKTAAADQPSAVVTTPVPSAVTAPPVASSAEPTSSAAVAVAPTTATASASASASASPAVAAPRPARPRDVLKQGLHE
jgi:serine/threonine-protein kinase